MSIQQSINQAIGIAGALATQTPMAAAHRENAVNEAKLKSESKNLEAKGEILKGILEGETKGKDYPESIIDELGEEGKNIQEFKKKNAQRRAQYAEDTKKRAQDALKKAEAERQAKADIKTRIITNINKWGETNG